MLFAHLATTLAVLTLAWFVLGTNGVLLFGILLACSYLAVFG